MYNVRCGSTTSASDYSHVLVVLQDDLVLLVQVEHRDGRELRGDAARLRCQAGVDRVDQRLHDRVIRRVEMVSDGKLTVSVTVVRFVARWRDDPIAPSHVAEVHVEGSPLAGFAAVLSSSISHWRPPSSVGVADGIPNRPLLVSTIVGVGEQQRLLVGPLVVTFVYTSSQSHVVVFWRGLWFSLALAGDLDEETVVLFG